MNNSPVLPNSSIAKKVLMALSGLFLVLFLLVHLSLNLHLLAGDGEVFNKAAHFMGTNPAMKIMEFVLAAGFVFHIIYSGILTLMNYKARPVRYKMNNPSAGSSWSSRNMGITGSMVLIFLIIHIMNFYYKIKFGEIPEVAYDSVVMEDIYTLVTSLFGLWHYTVIYVIGVVFLGLHLNHSFQSAFQTLGLNHRRYTPLIKKCGTVYALVIAIGFAIIPIYFLINAI